MDNWPNYEIYRVHELEKALENIDETKNTEEADYIRSLISKGGYKDPVETKERIEGIGGWLIIPVIGLFYSVFIFIRSLYKEHLPIYQNGVWDLVTDPYSDVYHALWAPMLIFEITYIILLLIFCIIVIVCLFKKHHLFPRLFIIFHITSLLMFIADYYFAGLIPAAVELRENMGLLNEIVKYMIGLSIWIPYMIYSQRVKNTFVRKA